MLKFAHLTNLRSPNVGNAALTLGSERTLEQDSENKIQFQRIAWDDYTFGKKSFLTDFVPEIINSDALLVAGAVTFNGRVDFREAGMRFNLSLDQIRSIEIPIIFYGVSYRYWSSEPYPNRNALRDALTLLCEDNKNKIAVRNDGTREWLKKFVGFHHENLSVIPDPGLFVRYGTQKTPKSDVPYVCLSLNNEDAVERFRNQENQEKFLVDIAGILSFILDNFLVDVYLVPHSFEDLALIENVTRKITPINLHQRVRVLGLPRFEDAESVYEVYQGASLVIASRVHSMSPALGMKVPVITVTTQDRLTHFMRELGLSDLVLDFESKELLVELKRLTFEILSLQNTYLSGIEDAVDDARLQIRDFNKEVLKTTRLHSSGSLERDEGMA